MKYFKNISNIEELKKQYKQLAIKHHPDNGGNGAVFNEITNEFKQALEKIGLNDNTAYATYDKVMTDTADWLEYLLKQMIVAPTKIDYSDWEKTEILKDRICDINRIPPYQSQFNYDCCNIFKDLRC